MNEDQYYPYLDKLLKYYPVYYFNFSYKPEDLDYLNKSKLSRYNIKIELVEKTGGRFALYKLSKEMKKDVK